MLSPLTPAFIRSFHPLPPSDRRNLLKEMGVAGVSHRDEDGFYEWLAARYRAGEMAQVDAALKQCCAKADERTSMHRLMTWITQQVGYSAPPPGEGEDYLAALIAHARVSSSDAAAVIDALAPNFAWYGATLDEAPSVTLNATHVADRLTRGLKALADEPDLDLLLRADALAAAIEEHLAGASDRAERQLWYTRAEAALADLTPEEDAGYVDLNRLDISTLCEIAEAAEAVPIAVAADLAARKALREAVDAPRAERRVAETARDDAEDALIAARDRLRDAVAADSMRGDHNVPVVDKQLSVMDLQQDIARQQPVMLQIDVSDTRTEDAPIDASEADAAILAEPVELADETHLEMPVGDTPVGSDPPTGDAPLPAPETELEPVIDPAAASVGAGRWNGWIASALAADRVGLALHLATARDLAGGGTDGVAATVLEGIVHGRATRAAYDRAWRRFENERGALIDAAHTAGATAAGQARVLLVAAGAVRPALLQSQAALDVLEALDGDMAARLNPLVKTLADLRHANIGSLDDLAAPAGEDERQARIVAARDALDRWRREAPRRKTGYQPATLIWQTMIAPGGAIGGVIAAIAAGAVDRRERAQVLIARLTDRGDAEQLIVETDEARSGRRHNPIEGPALRQLLNLCFGVADLLSEWLRADAGPATGNDRHRARRGPLLAGLRAARDVAIAAAPAGTALATAAGVFAAVVDQLCIAVEGGRAERGWTPDDELALLSAFPLNARHDVRIGADDALDLEAAADRTLDGGVPAPDDAFASALTETNASAATRLIPFLPTQRQAAATRELDAAVATARVAVRARARALRQKLDDLQIALDGDDRLPDEIERDMTGFEQAIEQGTLDALPLDSGERGDLADFPAATRVLNSIDTRLTVARAPVEARLRETVEQLEARLGTGLQEPRALLAKGDLGTLAESVAQIDKHGLSPSRPAASVALLTRFMRVVEALGDRPSVDLVTLQRSAREGRTAAPFDFGSLTELDRGRAGQLLMGAIGLKRAAGPAFKGDVIPALRSALADLLAALGFTGVRVEQVRRDASLLRADVTTNPLRDRQFCLAPAFGSGANGRYAIVIIPEGQVPSVRAQFDKLPQQVILLSLEALTSRLRRDLQRQARADTRSVALVDLVTIATLATEPELNTRALFDLALPFGAARPYADTSAQTSLEMFFGRADELRQLVDQNGPCLVYGGRQLGKTALLKQIALREDVEAGRLAIYMDIRPVGESAPTDEVWTRIESELRARRVDLPEGRSVPDRLRAWVTAAPGRYMLVLLDEADAFLEREMATDFPQIGRMKALMDETGRGVKFVFAGLHNVQRFHRAPNSPLLHFGKSINVGPLLGSDREAARQMALEPMAALGIAFEQPVDASHMLSLVGFYPSLMQSFGKTVVEAVNTRLKQPGEGAAMPFALDRALIDASFGHQEFRAGVVERFQKTLQLDERYELITYAVWQRAMQDVHEGRPTARGGYAGSAVRAMADEWWPQGFADTDSPDSFAALLDEMVEMGVLSREGERYALRSQRIAAMLGSKAEIEDKLEGFRHRRPKRRADPMTSHRRMDGGIWSPLSLRQEAVLRDRLARDLNPVSLIVIGASPAAGGGDDLWEAVKSLAQSVQWPDPRDISGQSAAVLLDKARLARREAHRGRPKLIVVRNAWPSAGDLAALRRDRALRDPAHPVRVIYLGAPTPEVLALDEGPDWMRMLLGPLPLDAMTHWMNREALGYAAREGMAQRLRRATGGFLQALDAIKLPASERGDPDRLIARAEAATLDRTDLGLDDDLAGFAAALGALIGEQPESKHDLERWAISEAPADGVAKLAMLRALGVLEPAPDDAEQLNPAAYRTLA